MNSSVFIAKVFSYYVLIVAIPMLLKPKYFKKLIKDLLSDTVVVSVMSFFIIILGLVMIQVHNIWVNDWRIIITIISWWVLLKGFVMFYNPKLLMKINKPVLQNNTTYYVALCLNIALAIFLLFQVCYI